MQLKYSFNGIEPCWFSGSLPFPEMQTERVKVRLSGRSSSHLPQFFEVGDLLCYLRPQECAVTLLLTYQHGTVPSSNSPPPMGVWYPEPGSPIYGQIRIALTPEAARQIRKAAGGAYAYELTLEDVDLVNTTKKPNA